MVGELGPETGDGSALPRVGRAASAWLTGDGLLRLHAGLFAVGAVSLVILDLYQNPGALEVRGALARWGIVFALHAGVVIFARGVREAARRSGAGQTRPASGSGSVVPANRSTRVAVTAPVTPSRFRPPSATSLEEVRPRIQHRAIRRDRDTVREVHRLAVAVVKRARIWDRRIERRLRGWWDGDRGFGTKPRPTNWGQRTNSLPPQETPTDAAPPVAARASGWTRRGWPVAASPDGLPTTAETHGPGGIRRDRSTPNRRSAVAAPPLDDTAKDEVVGWRPQRDAADRSSPPPERSTQAGAAAAPPAVAPEETTWAWLEAAAETRVARRDRGAAPTTERTPRWSDGDQEGVSFGD